MQTTARQELAIHKGQALALCWLLQQPVGSGGEVLAGLTRTLAFSRPLSGTDWAAVPPGDRERETRAFHQRVLRLFQKGLAIRCPVVARVAPTARGLTVDRCRDRTAQDQGLLQLLEARGDRLRRCRHCGVWFWRECKREYCGPCFQSGTARSKVHRAKAAQAGRRLTRTDCSGMMAQQPSADADPEGRTMRATRIRRHVNAPRASVYRALLDARAVATWMAPTGMTGHVHAFDPHVGGSFRISLTYDALTGTGKTTARADTFHGRFVTLVPHEQMVEVVEFETGDPALQGETTITIVLTDADGGTEILADHDGLPPGLSTANNEAGWRSSLAKLAALVEAR